MLPSKYSDIFEDMRATLARVQSNLKLSVYKAQNSLSNKSKDPGRKKNRRKKEQN